MPRVKRGVTARARHKKVITVRVAAFIVLPNRPSSKRHNMHIAIVVTESANFVLCGLFA